MNILILYNGSFPNGLAMTKRLKLYAKGLKESKNNVKIIIPHASEKFGSTTNKFTYGNHDGINFKYLSKKTTRSKYFLLRRINDFFGYLKLLKLILFNKSKINILLLIDIRNFWRILIYLVAKIKKAKVVYELNEHPLVFSSSLKVWLEKKIIFPLFDCFIVISDNLEAYVHSIKKKSAYIIVVPILTECSITPRKNINLNSNFILHSGGLFDEKEGIIGMIEAISIVNIEENIELNLYLTGNINNSPEREMILKRIHELKMSNHIEFLGYLNEKDLKKYQEKSLLFILNKKNNLQNQYCFPTKLGEYMLLAKPIIATDCGEYMKYLVDFKNSLIVEGSSRSIAEAIKTILNNPDLSSSISVDAQQTALNNFCYQFHTKRMSTLFKSNGK